ncbi:PilZ domain-containing protein [Sphingomonas sp. RHCKR47]|uniref:PilZ domain-containing protein n=1 Tax=Sphingomonas citricola TaxID=2862498 RepID=UPI001C677088|nr:PilZ domain-containing protein [Sphingomonas citricola]MBW6523605.1 PilZ domain-containing protein [Sphingomonas citricola]
MATFAAEFEPAQLQGRRRAPRAPVSFDVGLGGQGGFGRTLCKVVDLSLHGCRLQTYSAMTRGQTIWLNLPQIGPVAADVMWADDFTAGCQFHTPLDEGAYDTLVERFA